MILNLPFYDCSRGDYYLGRLVRYDYIMTKAGISQMITNSLKHPLAKI